MIQRSKRILVMVLAAAAVSAAGCGLPPTRVEFIEKLARENRKIARSAQAFRSAIKPLSNGTAPSADGVQKAYDDMQKAVKEAKGDVAGQLLPTSNSAKDLLAAYKKYLDGEQDILDDTMKNILQEIVAPPDAGGHPTLEERQAYVFGPAGNNGMLAQVGVKENDIWAPVKTAQEGYAGEHNFLLEPLGDYIAAQKAGKN